MTDDARFLSEWGMAHQHLTKKTMTRLGDLLTQQWTRQSYRLAMSHMVTLNSHSDATGTIEVDGIVMAEMPHIGIHMHVDEMVVTHLPTGKRIGSFPSLGAAMEFVHRIAYLYKWDQEGLVPPQEAKAVHAIQHTMLASSFGPRRPA